MSTGSGEPQYPLSRRRLGVTQAHRAGHGSRRACWQGRYPRSWPSGGDGPSDQSSPDYGSTPARRTQAAAQTTATSSVEQRLLLVAGPRQGALWWFRASPGVCTTRSMSNSWPRRTVTTPRSTPGPTRRERRCRRHRGRPTPGNRPAADSSRSVRRGFTSSSLPFPHSLLRTVVAFCVMPQMGHPDRRGATAGPDAGGRPLFGTGRRCRGRVGRRTRARCD